MKSLFTIILLFVCINVGAQSFNHRDSVNVIHYNIYLNISDLNSKKIKGHTKIRFVPQYSDTRLISFDILSLRVDSVLACHKKTDYVQKNDKITIILDKKYNNKDTICVDIYYHGIPATDPFWGGFYFSRGYAYNMGVGMGSFPHGFGRAWYPCIDSFCDRATYDYYITVKSNLTAVCSGILKNIEHNEQKSLKTFHWQLNKPIPTYLSSVAVGEYVLTEGELQSGRGEALKYTIYSTPSDKKKVKGSFAILQDAINAFEKYYGDYVWDKVGYVEVPFSSGAMEHVMNISLPFYVFTGNRAYQSLIVHELSHSWFGNLVTCESQANMWLNEGWASYSELLFDEYEYGIDTRKKNMRSLYANVFEYTHRRDGGYYALYGIPVSLTYGSTIYDKGSLVVHALRGYMGDSLFFGAIKHYLKKYAFQCVDVAELKADFELYSGIDLTDFFDFWVYSPGFPHFYIADFDTVREKNIWNINLKIKQNSIGTDNFLKTCKIDVTIFDKDINRKDTSIITTGKNTDITLKSAIKPLLVMLDTEEKIPDETIDNYEIFDYDADFNFKLQNFNISFDNVKQKSFIRCEKHFVEPTLIPKRYEIIKKSYWSVYIIVSDNVNTNAQFVLRDKNIKSVKNLKLLYRKNESDKWRELSAVVQGYGKYVFSVKNIKTGDYVIVSRK